MTAESLGGMHLYRLTAFKAAGILVKVDSLATLKPPVSPRRMESNISCIPSGVLAIVPAPMPRNCCDGEK